MYLYYFGVNVFAVKSGERINLRRLDLSKNVIEQLHEDQFIYLASYYI